MFGAKGPHVAIVGAGFGGLRAARRLSRNKVNLTLIDRRNHHLFHPLLYQVATATLPVTEITYPLRILFRKDPKTAVLLATATGIDLNARKVLFRDGELSYDYLILSTGSEATYFGHDEWRAWAPTLKTIEDGVEMRRRILLAFEQAEREPVLEERKSLLSFVIVGAGSTGVELAGALADLSGRVMSEDFRSIRPRDAQIVLVEAGPRILPEFPESLSARAEQSLARRGVEVLKSSPVTAVLADGVIIDDRKIKSRTVLWTAGVAPSPLARSLGTPLDRRGRVVVEPDLSIPGHPEAFAVGDIASFAGELGRPLPGVAPVAIQQGNHAARNIIALSHGGSSAIAIRGIS